MDIVPSQISFSALSTVRAGLCSPQSYQELLLSGSILMFRKVELSTIKFLLMAQQMKPKLFWHPLVVSPQLCYFQTSSSMRSGHFWLHGIVPLFSVI